MSEKKNKTHEYDDGEMTQEDWDDLVERMHSQNPGPLTEDVEQFGVVGLKALKIGLSQKILTQTQLLN